MFIVAESEVCMKKKSFVGGALILMAAGLIARILGFVFRIYLSNLIGAEGMGVFQLIAPVYTLVILTLTAGVSIAVSKMVAGENALHHPVNLRRITLCALALVMFAGAATSAAIYFNVHFVTSHILKDTRTYYSILLLIPCIPVIAAASALKGYFYGIQQVVPTAVSQIAEQIVKIGLVILLVGSFIGSGLEYACAVATMAMAFGEVANLAVLAAVYNLGRKRELKNMSRRGLKRKRTILSELVRTAAPISANRFVISIMSAVEYILIPGMLVAGGLDYKSSMEVYGRLSGMALPLIFFPSLVTSSLATTLVPAISEAVSLRNFRALNYRISKSIQITFILGIVFTAVFVSYPNEIGSLLYRKENIGELLYALSFSCTFIYLQQTLMGVLNGLGKQGILLRNTVIGSVIRIGFVYFLIPVYGIKSYVWGLITSFVIMALINLMDINRMTGLLFDVRNWVLRPCIVGMIMIATGRYIYEFFGIFAASGSLLTLLTLAANIFSAFFLMVFTGVLKKDEVLNLLPVKKH